VPTGERGSEAGVSGALFRRVAKQTFGLAVVLGLVLLVIGCEGTHENGTPTNADRSNEAKVRSEGQQAATRGQPNERSGQAGSADRNSQGKGPETAARPASDASGRGRQTIPGMSADAVAAVFLKPGLECWQPVDRDVLYACSSEGTHDLLSFGGKITGRGIDLVSTVEARVIREGSGDFGLASQPFFSLLSTQLEYRGANKERAYEFVTSNLDSPKASTTIGAAKWTITNSHDRTILMVAPGE
jgi:hypothetical protein